MPNALTLSGDVSAGNDWCEAARRDTRHVSHYWRCNRHKKVTWPAVPLGGRNIPCVTFRSPLPVSGILVLPCRPAVRTGRSGPEITKDVIYITLGIHLHNTERVGVSNALPALCMGKPITAGVVA